MSKPTKARRAVPDPSASTLDAFYRGAPTSTAAAPYAYDPHPLAGLLAPVLGGLGPEREIERRDYGRGRYPDRAEPTFVVVLQDPYGSYRYMAIDREDVPVAALQLMSRDGRTAVLANAYARPEVRSTKIVPRMLAMARERFAVIQLQGGAGTAAGTYRRRDAMTQEEWLARAQTDDAWAHAHNPPGFVTDEACWTKAKHAAAASGATDFWAFAVWWYREHCR